MTSKKDNINVKLTISSTQLLNLMLSQLLLNESHDFIAFIDNKYSNLKLSSLEKFLVFLSWKSTFSEQQFYRAADHLEAIFTIINSAEYSNNYNNIIVNSKFLTPSQKLYSFALCSLILPVKSSLEKWLNHLIRNDHFDSISESLEIIKILRAFSQERLFLKFNSQFDYRPYFKIYRQRLSQFIKNNYTIPIDNLNSPTTPACFLFIIDFIPPNKVTGAHLRQVISYTSGLAKLSADNKVYIVITSESLSKEGGFPWRVTKKDYQTIIREEFFRLASDVLDKNLYLFFGNYTSDKKYIDNLLTYIEKQKPHVVLRWGGVTESIIFDDYLKNYFPYIYIQFNYHSIPDFDFDLILAQGYRTTFYGLPNENQWRNHKIPLNVITHNKNNNNNNNTHQLSGITVLGGGRLENTFFSYSSNIINSFLKLFQIYPNLTWMFIGVEKIDKIITINKALKKLYRDGRIKSIANHPELGNVYQNYDIYAHLPKLEGGAMGIAMAIDADLPVIIWNTSDATNFLPENAVFNTPKDYFLKLRELLQNKSYRKQLALEQKIRLRQHSPENSAKELIAHCKEAIDFSKKRFYRQPPLGFKDSRA